MALTMNPITGSVEVLFQNAIAELQQVQRIQRDARNKKKDIIKRLAKNLEGKIGTDLICIEITKKLTGIVSERFVRKCLEEKYKQSYRTENARKQKEKQHNTSSLAALVPLKSNPDNSTKKKSTNIPKVSDAHGSDKATLCPNCKKLSEKLEIQMEEKEELKAALLKATEVSTADKLLYNSAGTLKTHNENHHNQIVDLRFALSFDDIHSHMMSLVGEKSDLEYLQFMLRINQAKLEASSISITILSNENDTCKILKIQP